jgi:hypothetical protein
MARSALFIGFCAYLVTGTIAMSFLSSLADKFKAKQFPITTQIELIKYN